MVQEVIGCRVSEAVEAVVWVVAEVVAWDKAVAGVWVAAADRAVIREEASEPVATACVLNAVRKSHISRG